MSGLSDRVRFSAHKKCPLLSRYPICKDIRREGLKMANQILLLLGCFRPEEAVRYFCLQCGHFPTARRIAKQESLDRMTMMDFLDHLINTCDKRRESPLSTSLRSLMGLAFDGHHTCSGDLEHCRTVEVDLSEAQLLCQRLLHCVRGLNSSLLQLSRGRSLGMDELVEKIPSKAIGFAIDALQSGSNNTGTSALEEEKERAAPPSLPQHFFPSQGAVVPDGEGQLPDALEASFDLGVLLVLPPALSQREGTRLRARIRLSHRPLSGHELVFRVVDRMPSLSVDHDVLPLLEEGIDLWWQDLTGDVQDRFSPPTRIDTRSASHMVDVWREWTRRGRQSTVLLKLWVRAWNSAGRTGEEDKGASHGKRKWEGDEEQGRRDPPLRHPSSTSSSSSSPSSSSSSSSSSQPCPRRTVCMAMRQWLLAQLRSSQEELIREGRHPSAPLTQWMLDLERAQTEGDPAVGAMEHFPHIPSLCVEEDEEEEMESIGEEDDSFAPVALPTQASSQGKGEDEAEVGCHEHENPLSAALSSLPSSITGQHSDEEGRESPLVHSPLAEGGIGRAQAMTVPSSPHFFRPPSPPDSLERNGPPSLHDPSHSPRLQDSVLDLQSHLRRIDLVWRTSPTTAASVLWVRKWTKEWLELSLPVTLCRISTLPLSDS